MGSDEFAQSFRVGLLADDSKQWVSVDAATRHLAANAAERMVPGSRAFAVFTGSSVVGRCRRCRSVVFADERPRRDATGVSCADC